MIHIAKSLAAKAVLLLLVLIILIAFVIGSLRLLTPAASYFRGELERWVSQQVQRPVRIGGLSAHWRGLGPEIVLDSVEIDAGGTSHTVLRLKEIRLGMAILESLRDLEIKTRQIAISQINLRVARYADGSFTVGGLGETSGSGGGGSGLFAMPSFIRLEKSTITYEDQLTGARPVVFRNVDAVLHNDGERHQLEAELTFADGDLELRADVQRDVSRSGGWKAELYLKGRDIALTEFPRLVTRDYSIPSGRLGMEIWGHWEDGHFDRIEGRGDVAQLLLLHEAADSAPGLHIDRSGGNFLWTAKPGGWQLDVRNFEFVRNGSAWPESGLSISTHYSENELVQLLAGVNFARAGDLAAFAGFFSVRRPELAEALEKTAAQGELRDLRFEFERKESESLWSLQGRFDALATQPWKKIPGVKDLDADFWLSGDKGDLLLDGQSTVLHFPGLFRDPLELKLLQGHISWKKQAEGGWQLESPDILAVTNDIRTNTRLFLDIPAQDEQPVFMDLQTDFSDGLAINAHRYYPVGIMPDAVVSWLDRGIVDGLVTSGSALVRGPLNDFPFHKTQNGRFEVLFNTDNMTIDYSPGWPRLTNVAAEVRFLQNGFDIQLHRGMIFDSRLNQVQGQITDFSNSPFELKGSVQGALQNNLRLLRESPLAAEFEDFAGQMSAEGEALTLIDLKIPIRPGQQFSLDGNIDFGGSSLNLKEWQLPLTDIQGKLNFSERDIEAGGIKAKALGSSVTIGIKTLSKPRLVTRITASTQVSSQQLARRFSGFDFRSFSGSSQWMLNMDIPHRSAEKAGAPSIQVSSDLRGLAVEMPAPLAKAANDSRRFTLSTEFPESGARSVYVEYGPLLDIALLLNPDSQRGQKINRGAIQLGGETASIPSQEGIEIGGRLKFLDLAAWAGLLQSATGKGNRVPLNRIELDVERLTAGELQLDNLRVALRREGEALNGELSSRQAEGNIQIPDDILRQPIRGRLKRLSLNYTPGPPGQPRAGGSASMDPARLPALDLEVEKSEINGKDYGTLQLISRHIPAGQELQTFSVKAGQLQLSASGSWTKVETGGQRSRLQLSMTTDSLGKLLDDLGYQKYIDRAPAEIDGQLDWQDSPGGFRPDILNGRISLQLGKGQFLNVDPGLGRVFGLLNITALQRRLSLDFSDLLNKGLAFDSVAGSFELDAGDAYTTDFQIKGPSAQVDISGRTGLASEDFDQLVTVTPHLSAALPVAGLIAGGPVGGAAMLLAQGLIGKEFDKASKRQYEVKGSWKDPALTLLTGKQMPADLKPEEKQIPDGSDTDATRQIDEEDSSANMPWLFELLKKQFTPTRGIDQEGTEAAAPGADP